MLHIPRDGDLRALSRSVCDFAVAGLCARDLKLTKHLSIHADERTHVNLGIISWKTLVGFIVHVDPKHEDAYRSQLPPCLSVAHHSMLVYIQAF
jgi:hypothetical protein